MRRRALLPAVATAAALLACGPTAAIREAATSSPAAPVEEPNAPTEPSPTGAAEATTVSPLPVDVSGYVACEVVTPQDVADLVGGPIFRELPQEPGPGCVYEIEAGPGGYAQFIVYIEPPDLLEATIEALPEDLGQPQTGLGDAAFLQYEQATDTYHLDILVRDRFGLEIIGEGEAWTVGLGTLFLSRLTGS